MDLVSPLSSLYAIAADLPGIVKICLALYFIGALHFFAVQYFGIALWFQSVRAGLLYWRDLWDQTIIFVTNIPLYSLEMTAFIQDYQFTMEDLRKVMFVVFEKTVSAMHRHYALFTPMEWVAHLHSCAPPQSMLYFWVQPQTNRYCELYNKVYMISPVLSRLDLYVIAVMISLYIIFLLGLLLWLLRHRIQEVVTMLLELWGSKHRILASNMRSIFNSLPLSSSSAPWGHTHGESAADRSAASSFAETLAAQLGLTPYFAQMSLTDQRKGRLGSRASYWAKDFNSECRFFDPPDNSLMTLVDVDEYFNMPEFLCDNFGPTLVYTFQPEQVARNATEYNFTFDEKNRVHYRVTGGGGPYIHKVWSYSSDSFLFTKSLFGFPYKVVSYLVERKKTCIDHEVIFLVPLTKWTGFSAVIAAIFLSGPLLRHLEVAKGGFLRLLVSFPGGLRMSTGKVGCYTQADVPVEKDDMVSGIANTSKYDLTLPQCQSALDDETNKPSATVLMEYHRTKSGDKPPVVCPVGQGTNTYEFVGPKGINLEGAKPMQKEFMSPILPNCYVPLDTVANEQVAVNERVLKVKNGPILMHAFLRSCMLEFVCFCIPDKLKNTLEPYDADYIFDKQCAPNQRRILETGMGVDPEIWRVINGFMKKESYQGVKAPRIISQINATDKFAYSGFIYALVDRILKQQKWYAFGRCPLETAQIVADICSRAKSFTINTDFDKYDGRVSNVLRELEQMILLRAFKTTHHAKLVELHGSMFNLRTFMMHLVSFFMWLSRGSGGPDTACFNGLDNAFINYYARRLKNTLGECYSPEEAWDSLGIYGGDDGLTADLDPDCFIRAASAVGQVVKVERVARGALGVKFLSRQYSPDVWFGSLDSCCDLPRQLTKIHVTTSLPESITPEMKLLEKMRAFSLTDRNTPIIGELVARALFFMQGQLEETAATSAMRIWGADIPLERQYPNEPGEWMWEYAQLTLPDAALHLFREWLRNTRSLHDLLEPPLLIAPAAAKSTLPVVVKTVMGEAELIGKVLEKSDVKGKGPKVKLQPGSPEWEEWKKRRIDAGKWVDKPMDKVYPPAKQ